MRVQKPHRADFVFRKASLGTDAICADGQAGTARDGMVEVTDFMQENRFDELRLIHFVVEIGKPLELHAIQDDVAFDDRAVICEMDGGPGAEVGNIPPTSDLCADFFPARKPSTTLPRNSRSAGYNVPA